MLPVCIAQLAVLSTKTKEVKAGKVIDGVISSPQIELSPKVGCWFVCFFSFLLVCVYFLSEHFL